MNKKGFVRALRRSLRSLSREEKRATLAYYTEMIQDGMEEGLSEEQAVARLGSADEIAGQLLQNASGIQDAGRKRKIGAAGIIALAVMAAPVWLPVAVGIASLALAIAAMVLSAYVCLWAVIISLYAADLALAACGPAGLLGLLAGFSKGNPAQALFFLGAGCALLGFALLMLVVLNCCTAAIARFTGWSVRGMAGIFGRRRLHA